MVLLAPHITRFGSRCHAVITESVSDNCTVSGKQEVSSSQPDVCDGPVHGQRPARTTNNSLCAATSPVRPFHKHLAGTASAAAPPQRAPGNRDQQQPSHPQPHTPRGTRFASTEALHPGAVRYTAHSCVSAAVSPVATAPTANACPGTREMRHRGKGPAVPLTSGGAHCDDRPPFPKDHTSHAATPVTPPRAPLLALTCSDSATHQVPPPPVTNHLSSCKRYRRLPGCRVRRSPLCPAWQWSAPSRALRLVNSFTSSIATSPAAPQRVHRQNPAARGWLEEHGSAGQHRHPRSQAPA